MSDNTPRGNNPHNSDAGNHGRSSRDFASGSPTRPSNTPSKRDRAEGDSASKANPKAVASAKAASAKQTAKTRAVQAAAKSFGIPLNDKLAGKVVVAIQRGWKIGVAISLVFVMVALMAMTMLFGGRNSRSSDGIAVESEVYVAMDSEVLQAYKTSAARFEAPDGQPIPWTIAAAIGTIATEHGRFSPYDTCDRYPSRGESVMFPDGIPSTYTNGDCGPIEGDSDDAAVGPFLFAPSYADGNSDFQSFEKSLDILNELISETAKDLDRQDWISFPDEFPTTEEGLAEVDAFWAEVVSRLPIVNPITADPCTTPAPEFDEESVAGAVKDIWTCELLRAKGMTHVTNFINGEYITEPGSEAIDRIVSEALHVASAWSAMGTRNTAQQMCGRTPIVGGEIGAGVTIIGDSLTVGARDFGQLETTLLAAGATTVQVDAFVGATSTNFVNSGFENNRGDIVVFALGTNDLGLDTETYESNIKALFRTATRQNASDIYFVNIGQVGSQDPAAHNAALDQAVGTLSASVLRWSDLDGIPYAGDGVHLTSSGYKMRSDFLAEALALANPGANGVPSQINGEPIDGAAEQSYAGIFPMSVDLFNEFNPVDGASRCDFGPNMHAAVLAFINYEQVELDNRSADRGPYQPVLGGWEHFYSVSDVNFPVVGQDLENRTDSLECKAAIQEWVDVHVSNSDITVNTGDLSIRLYAVDTETNTARPDMWAVNNPDSDAVLDLIPELEVRSLGECGQAEIGETSREVTGYAAFIAREAYLSAAAELQTQDNENSDSGIDGYTLDDVDPGTPTFAVTDPANPNDPGIQAARFYTASQILNYRSEQAAFGYVDVDNPVKTTAILPRFSSNGKSVQPSTEIIPMSASSAGTFPKSVIALAVKIAGISGDSRDTRAVASPFGDVPRLSGRLTTTTSFLAIGGVPYGLLDAVNTAVANIATIAPGCSADAAFLLATAKAETGPWWSRIQADGTMVPALTNEWDASGPFQFIPGTWETWKQTDDANVQNSYDAAAASLAMQCAAAERYDGNLLSDETAWQVAVDYHDGAGRDRDVSEECRTSGAYLTFPAAQPCAGEAYGYQRVLFANEYRALMQDMYFALQSDPGYDPNSETGRIAARAVTIALEQVGKPYCRPMNEYDENPDNDCVVPVSELETEFTGSNSSGNYELLTQPVIGGGAFNLGPDAFDCSGLTFASYYKAGMDLGIAYSNHQFTAFERVEGELQPGDLLFYNWDDDVATEHVTMYIGSGLVVHAAGSKVGVVVNPVTTKGYVGATRPVANYSEDNATTPVAVDSPDVELVLDTSQMDPTLAIYVPRQGDYECEAKAAPDLYGGHVEEHMELLVVPVTWFEEYAALFNRPELAAAAHYEGTVRVQEEQCQMWQESPNDSRAHLVYWDLLAHESSHALDYSLGWISETLDFPITNLGHAGTYKSPNRELFAFCMQRLAMGQDIIGRCPDENYELAVSAVEQALGTDRSELQLDLDSYDEVHVHEEDPTQQELDAALSEIGGAL